VLGFVLAVGLSSTGQCAVIRPRVMRESSYRARERILFSFMSGQAVATVFGSSFGSSSSWGGRLSICSKGTPRMCTLISKLQDSPPVRDTPDTPSFTAPTRLGFFSVPRAVFLDIRVETFIKTTVQT